MRQVFISFLLSAILMSCEEKVSLRSEKQLIEFSLPDVPQSEVELDETGHTVKIVVPRPTSLKTLKPSVTVSEGATVSPASGVSKDFSKPVSYTVSAEDGSTQVYTATAIYRQASESRITSFKVTSYNPDAEGVIDQEARTILLIVPNKNTIKTLKPTVTVSDGATVSPASGEAQDFTTPVSYSVTAENGSQQTYVVTAKSLEKKISAFTFKDFTPDAKGTINQTDFTIEVLVPAGCNPTALKPSITYSAGATLTPASDVVQDFSKPVTYTVMSEEGKTQTYLVTVRLK